MLGAAWIADRAMLPAISASGNATATAIASRDASRAHKLAEQHGIPHVLPSYDALVESPDIDAVYIGLVNSLHREWATRALAAGKHVLCEKPLAPVPDDVRAMATAAEASGRLLMEAFMYRFHPRMQAMRAAVSGVHFLHAGFAFALGRDHANYRWHAELGGGALLDVGCYTLDVARWFLGEPERVFAGMYGEPVDTGALAALTFPGGAVSTSWASFDGPEYQELVVVDDSGLRRVRQPFTSWRDPDDPYQLMVEAFSASALDGRPSPLPLSESLATAALVDRVRREAQRASVNR